MRGMGPNQSGQMMGPRGMQSQHGMPPQQFQLRVSITSTFQPHQSAVLILNRIERLGVTSITLWCG